MQCPLAVLTLLSCCCGRHDEPGAPAARDGAGSSTNRRGERSLALGGLIAPAHHPADGGAALLLPREGGSLPRALQGLGLHAVSERRPRRSAESLI